MKLDPLYHWSPVERRKEIRAHGLQPYKRTSVSSDGVVYPYICLSPTASMAWGLSGDMDWVSEIEDWDLWQVEIPKNAEVHVRSTWGSTIEEVKVYTPIPANFLWLVGTRTVPFAEEVENGKEGTSTKTKSRKGNKT